MAKNGSLSSHLLSELISNDSIKLLLKEQNVCVKDASSFDGLRYLANCANPLHESTIENIILACELDIDNNKSFDHLSIISALHHCSVFYENIGALEKTLATALKMLEYSKKYGSNNQQRLSHSVISSAYARLCEFDRAFFHSHNAYKIAQEENDAISMFMALVNTVSILEIMGLLHDAQKLCIKIARDQPFGDEKLDVLHLTNASNGMRISHILKDQKGGSELYKIAFRSAKTESRYLTIVNRAHYDAARIVQLALQGDVEEAGVIADHLLVTAKEHGNINIIAVILCAQAECNLISQNLGNIFDSICAVQKWAEEFKGATELYESLLAVLIKSDMFLTKHDSFRYESRIKHFTQLHKLHSLGRKHKNFFTCFAKESNERDSEPLLENPSYQLPFWIQRIISEDIEDGQINIKNAVTQKNAGSRIPHDIFELSRRFGLKGVLSPFDVLENWAFAVERIFGCDGSSGIRVGRLAGDIARIIGYSAREIPVLEYACRFHDIGKFLLLSLPIRHEELKAFGRFSLLSRHTSDGARLLGLFDNEALELASSIALSHHEWWNGCGYPAGKKGDQIPIEARICAIAEFIVSHVHPSGGAIPWSLSAAVRQAQTMTGVQFDPELCAVLDRVFQREGEGLNYIELIVYEGRQELCLA